MIYVTFLSILLSCIKLYLFIYNLEEFQDVKSSIEKNILLEKLGTFTKTDLKKPSKLTRKNIPNLMRHRR